ncbi:serine/threonine protein kinase [Pseudoscardovia radai]|uniref:non-specific serine/threonine protein kinase n=1 Tax=Pseudoscardovia radai TaxID=987066 RepID=A0A261ESE2_9BIFI|nr:serine/threonine-protein kinase [Pseudoscardovia radai]OZG49774.1 serine/threonine protein kinase [Pseudoscardovia radai]
MAGSFRGVASHPAIASCPTQRPSIVPGATVPGAPPHNPFASAVAGRYRLLDVVGRGGMSLVWVAADLTLNKLWAVKQIRAEAVYDARIRESFLTEAELMKRFDHPGIPRIVDLVHEESRLYVVMDYVEGRTLRDILRDEGPRPPERVVDWGLQLCDVIGYLHGRAPAVVYRDVKPGNIMLTPEGRIRLVDFGIAMVTGGSGGEGGGDGGAGDGAGGARGVGTPGFSAPEQFDAPADVDERADIYGIGATMYALLSGRHPGRGRQAFPWSCPPRLRETIRRCMSRDPSHRYASCADLAYALDHVGDDDGRRRVLVRRRRLFRSVAAFSALSLGASPCCAAMADRTRERDWGRWMASAERSTDIAEAQNCYLRAIALRPDRVEPYEGLIRLAKTDGVLDSVEEAMLALYVIENGEALRSNESWPRLCYDIGILYWHYYDSVAGDSAAEDGAGGAWDGSAGSAAGGIRHDAIAAAAPWMREAAGYASFPDAPCARVYADIADFVTTIVPRINEGTDGGLYGEFFADLEELVDIAGGEAGNDVIALEASDLALSSLCIYPRHFRRDGIGFERMESLARRAEDVARRVEPITTERGARRQTILDRGDEALAAAQEAFDDPAGYGVAADQVAGNAGAGNARGGAS